MEAGRELDKLVAEKVEGWVVKNGTAYDPVGGAWDASREWMPYYSTDMSDAWLVVNKLNLFSLHNWELRLQMAWRHPDADTYPDDDSEIWIIADDAGNEWSRADTAPLAICLAALKAVGFKVVP